MRAVRKRCERVAAPDGTHLSANHAGQDAQRGPECELLTGQVSPDCSRGAALGNPVPAGQERSRSTESDADNRQPGRAQQGRPSKHAKTRWLACRMAGWFPISRLTSQVEPIC
jgi:hypothetical protein